MKLWIDNVGAIFLPDSTRPGMSKPEITTIRLPHFFEGLFPRPGPDGFPVLLGPFTGPFPLLIFHLLFTS